MEGLAIHAATTFPLTGSHLQISCESCHTDEFDGAFAPLDPSCIGCHEADYISTSSGAVDHVAVGFPTSCEACHNTLAFSGATAFDHAAVSGGFGLVGAHISLDCSACHNPGDLEPLFNPADQNDCFTCHEDDYNETATTSILDHAAANLPTDCLQCHTVDSWQGATIDHPLVSGGFALVGAHMNLDCASCHSNPDFSVPGNPSSQNDCVACHEADHQKAHPNFPTTCLDCHGIDSWEAGAFDHSVTGFALVGAHIDLDCSSCHVGPDNTPIWIPTSQDDCFTCHEDDHQDEHPNFPTTCLDCHTTDSWDADAFDHAATTGFGLLGAHMPLDCSSCHLRPGFELIWEPSSADDCVTCHEDDAIQAHTGFPTTCLDCHTTDTWDSGSFDHAGTTGFPLLGAHLPLDCSSCHQLPGFELIWEPSSADDCVTCHEDDAIQAHTGFPTTCQDCHSTDTWDSGSFDHSGTTGFPLLGAHLPLDCSSCHILPGFELIWEPSSAQDCVTCHEDDHQDRHPNFPTTCLDCHTTDTWDDATFDHGTTTGFPLVGAHMPLDCSSCHLLPGFELIWDPSSADDCVTCHEDDHQNNHPNFPTTCLDCHTTDSWDSDGFDHGATTGFPLLGAHMPLDCSSCHLLPGFELIWEPSSAQDCVTCHEDDANQAHTGFPTTCRDCHTVDSWDSTFDHDPIFPIYSGRHQGEWATCQTCHTDPGNFMTFSCFTCHEHNRPDTDDRHRDVGGYVYESNACYSCHPNGRSDDLGRVR